MLWLLRRVGAVMGVAAYVTGVRRRVTQENLLRAFPNRSAGSRSLLAIKSYANLGIVFFEFAYLRFASSRAILDGLQFENLDAVAPLARNPNGAILLSGHLGDWEWLALAFGLAVRPLHIVMKIPRSSVAAKFMERMRSRFGNYLVDAGNVRRIFRILRDGNVAAILGDQAPSADSVQVPFFGQPVHTFEGTARLALRTRAPIIFIWPSKRTRSGYVCCFESIPYDDLTDASDENIRKLTARHTAFLEGLIRSKPEFWLWQHRRWKHSEELTR